MNSDGEYYIPEKIEDEVLRSVADMAKEVLKENDILEDILQKYIVAYNKTLKERCSAKSLKVMNQNHKLVFSTITSSGVIKSPRCTSVSTKKDAKVPCIINPQLRTPLKTNRINSSTERKRLSFDVADNEYMKPVHTFTEDSDGGQMPLDTSQSFFKYEDEAKLYDRPEERFNPDGIPGSVATLPIFNEAAANLSTETPDIDQTMVITPEKKNRIPVHRIFKEESNAWYLKCRPSFFSCEIVPKASDSPEEYIQERFNLEGKPETITSLAIYDHDDADLPAKTADNHQMMLASPEEKNSTLVNYAIDDRKSDRCLEISPSFFTSKKEAKVTDKQNTNEQESFRPDEKHETVSSLTVDHLQTSCISFKTPDKLQKIADNPNKEEKAPINQIVVKRVTVEIATNDKEFFTPTTDIKASNNPKMKKRKSIDYSEEAIMATNLVTEDQEFTVPPKISKINNELTTDDEKSTISGDVSVINHNDSTSATDESAMDANNSFLSADNSAMKSNDSLNRPDDDFIVDQDVAESDGKFIMSAVPINNSSESMSISPAEISENPKYQSSITQDCAPFFSPEADQKKIAVESDIRNSKTDKIKISAYETKDVESLTNLMQNLSPSVKRSYDDTSQKSTTNGSVSVETTSVGKLCLRENLSKTATPPRECLISNEPSPKPDDSYAIQAVKFIETLKQRKSRFYMYLHLFVEDQQDLRFIRAYIVKLAAVMEKIPLNDNNEVLMKINDFAHKGTKLLRKANSWELDIEKELEVWEDCIQKIKQFQQDVMRFCSGKKRNLTPKDFQKWEESFRIVNKKGDDMILLREVRRPTIIQFVYELENLFQLFIQIMLLVGLLKHSARVPFDYIVSE
ncbi:hypothetical protein AVEN_167981-1 [Araneus ventricosus]|uniref:Uncharacterized protein n=1 Tax=Araneus ventricosus TaxID=182803 RepID=A0A4Y2PVW6_ARAVE|nr:hypothetical protein AVEN_167981-1 [Araneus ventricosus]